MASVASSARSSPRDLEQAALLGGAAAAAPTAAERAAAGCKTGCVGLGCLCFCPGALAVYFAAVLIYSYSAGYFEGKGCIENLTQGLADKYGKKFDVKPTDGRPGNFTHRPNVHLWPELQRKMRDPFDSWTGNSYAYASAEDMPLLLFNGTKVDGLFETIPKKFRGVFWMDGNPLPEILATFQYGRWFEEEKILITPKAPYCWAFWGGEGSLPNYEPNCPPLSFVHSVCPFTPAMYNVSGRETAQIYSAGVEDLWVVKVDAGLDEGPLRARMQMNALGDLAQRWVFVPPEGVPQEFTFDEESDPAAPEATRFHRGIHFACGKLPPWPYGYTAKKIVDHDGRKVQPFFDEYLRFMGNTSLIAMSNSRQGW